MKTILKYVAIVLLVVLVIIQFINRPEKISEPVTENDILLTLNTSRNMSVLLKSACYDCHSNQPRYPWYSEIAPFSWWIGEHIEHGRDELNFSDWATFSKRKRDHKLEEIVEEVEKGHMPLPKYTWMHSDARLSEEQITRLKLWVGAERARIALED